MNNLDLVEDNRESEGININSLNTSGLLNLNAEMCDDKEVYNGSATVLNLDHHFSCAKKSTVAMHDPSIFENVLCEVKWFGEEKRFGFLRVLLKDNIADLVNTYNRNPTSQIIEHYRKVAADLADHNDSNGSEISREQDIFIHGSKLNLFETECFLNGGDILLCNIFLSARGPQVETINRYFIAPRDTTPKMCNGYIKWFNPEQGYGFVKSDQVQNDIFVSGKNLLKYKINPATLKKNTRVTCYYIIQENKYIAQKIELLLAINM